MDADVLAQMATLAVAPGETPPGSPGGPSTPVPLQNTRRQFTPNRRIPGQTSTIPASPVDGPSANPVRARDFRQQSGYLFLLMAGEFTAEPARKYWFELNGGYLSWFREERRLVATSVWAELAGPGRALCAANVLTQGNQPRGDADARTAAGTAADPGVRHGQADADRVRHHRPERGSHVHRARLCAAQQAGRAAQARARIVGAGTQRHHGARRAPCQGGAAGARRVVGVQARTDG